MGVKYIIGHWTGGNHKPNSIDKMSYQLLIDDEGKKYPAMAVGCSSSTGGMNSITYNISCCGGLERSEITPIQMEAFCKTAAEKIKEFNLKVSDFYTHAEIGKMCKDKTITKLLPYNQYLHQNIGKIDLTVLPFIKGTPEQTGNYLRGKIKWYMSKI